MRESLYHSPPWDPERGIHSPQTFSLMVSRSTPKMCKKVKHVCNVWDIQKFNMQEFSTPSVFYLK